MGAPQALTTIRIRTEAFARRFWRDAHAPVDAASLAFFRMAFGAAMMGEAFVYMTAGYLEHYIEAEYLFKYWGFGWVHAPPGQGIYALMALIGVSAGAIMVGYQYRAATIVFFLSFTWFFLLEAAEYLNHFYLVVLIAFLMIFLPADRLWSVDSRRRGTRSDHIPAWALWLVRFQIAVVYVGGGLAKLNPDWLRGEPMKKWLAWESDFPVIGKAFENELVGLGSSYVGLLLDLYIVPFLLWRPTRPFAFMAIVWFHLMNHTLFHIGVFPWLMILATTIFFKPDWPRAVLRWIGGGSEAGDAPKRFKPDTSRKGKVIAAVLMLFVAYNVVMPMRHWAYEGDPSWTEEGHRYAWHMKLRHKSADVTFTVVEAGEEPYEWDLDDELTNRQIGKMSVRPDMIQQYARHIQDVVEADSGGPVQVYVNATASLNFRPEQPFIDPTVDLASEPYTILPKDWIIPMQYTLDGEPIGAG